MKAIRIHEHGGPEVLRYEEVCVPAPGPGEVLVKVEAIGVNYADVAWCRGKYVTAIPLPLIPGHEIAGTIERLGPGVSDLLPGTRVVALELQRAGAYAEYAVMEARNVFPIPDQLDTLRAASFLLQGVTASQILHDAGRLQPGEKVLIHGSAGGVGTLAIQQARLLGAGKIIGTTGNEAKLDLIRSLGADVAIDYSNPRWVEQVKEATDGSGVDLVLEMVGGDMVQQSLECLAPFGRIVLFGAASGQSGKFVGLQLTRKSLSATGYWLPIWLDRPEGAHATVATLINELVQGSLRPIITHTFPLAEAAVAHRLMLERQTTGKTILVV